MFQDYGFLPSCVKRCAEVRSIKWQLILQKILILMVMSTQKVSRSLLARTQCTYTGQGHNAHTQDEVRNHRARAACNLQTRTSDFNNSSTQWKECF